VSRFSFLHQVEEFFAQRCVDAFLEVGTLADYDFLGRIEPLAAVIDAAVGAGGVEDVAGGGAEVVGVFEDGLDYAAEILAAELVEAGGAGVTVDGLAIPEVVGAANVIGAYPVDEIAFEGGAIGMVADEAFAGVAFGVGFGFGRRDTFEGLVGRGHLRGLRFGDDCGGC
jgi:hypothetical protein